MLLDLILTGAAIVVMLVLLRVFFRGMNRLLPRDIRGPEIEEDVEGTAMRWGGR